MGASGFVLQARVSSACVDGVCDFDMCRDWRREKLPFAISGRASDSSVFSMFSSCASRVRDLFQTRLPCKNRRSLRMPLALRDLYHRSSVCSDPIVAASLRSQAFRMHRTWVHDMRIEQCKRKVDRGHILFKPSKLKFIKSLKNDECSSVHSQQEIANLAAKTFSGKWGCSNLQSRMNALDFLQTSELSLPRFQETNVEVALLQLKRKSVLDIDMFCVSIFQLMFEGNPTEFTNWLRFILSSSTIMRSLRAKCSVFGKTSSSLFVDELRAIVPMSSLLRLLDRILGNILKGALETVLPPIPGCFAAGKRYTQALDIGHSVNLAMEKGLDMESEVAVAQADVSKYFDSLPILSILRWLLLQGMEPALVGALGRFQLLTTVVVHVGSATCAIDGRSQGGLTGSFVALLLARVPMESSMAELGPSLHPCGLHLDRTELLIASYTENIYAVSRYSSSACVNIELFSKHLKDIWGLDIKGSSKEVMACKGANEIETVGEGWIIKSSMAILGWCVQMMTACVVNGRLLFQKLVSFRKLQQT